MSWQDEFADFVPTTKESLRQNEPGKRVYSDRTTFLSSEIKLVKPKQDVTSAYRILPNPTGHFAIQIRIHYNIGVEKGSCACWAMKNQECPLCKESRKAYNRGDKKLGGDLNGKTYYLSWIIDRQNQEAGPQLFQYPATTYERIYNQIEHPTTKRIRSLDHPAGGHDLFFKKREGIVGSGFQTIEDIMLDSDQSPLGTDEQITQWLRYVREHNPIEDYMIYIDQEKLKTLMSEKDFGGGESDGFDGQNWDQNAQPQATPVAQVNPAPAGVTMVNPAPTPVAQVQAPVEAPIAAPVVAPVPAPEGDKVLDIDALRKQLENRPRD